VRAAHWGIEQRAPVTLRVIVCRPPPGAEITHEYSHGRKPVVVGGVDLTLVRLLLSGIAVVAVVVFFVWALRSLGR
jgi:hypothetical protein